MEYTIPKNLLTTNSVKTLKGEKKGYIVGLTYKRASIKGGGDINKEAFDSGFAIKTEVKKLEKEFV